MGMTHAGMPITPVAVEVDLTHDEMMALPEERQWLDKAVAIYLGDLEITRITGEDLVLNRDGYIILDETVAQWLRARVAAPAVAR